MKGLRYKMKSKCCNFPLRWIYNDVLYIDNALYKIVPHFICSYCLKDAEVDPKEFYLDGDGNIIKPS